MRSQHSSLFSIYADNIKSVGGRPLKERQFPQVIFHETIAKVIAAPFGASDPMMDKRPERTVNRIITRERVEGPSI